jgi:uncharacterized phage-associated protein
VAGRTEFNPAKFKELVLLLAERSVDDPLMSRVKLNKLLYYADFESYRRRGRSITGATYVKGEFGPMAAELPGAEKELGRAGYLTWRTDETGPHPRKIPVALEKADETQFIEEELGLVSDALMDLKDLGGAGARDWSHNNSAGWNLVEDEAPIPYSTTFISTDPIPKEDIERARELALERTWADIRP